VRQLTSTTQTATLNFDYDPGSHVQERITHYSSTCSRAAASCMSYQLGLVAAGTLRLLLRMWYVFPELRLDTEEALCR
jgi:hypothetical protein